MRFHSALLFICYYPLSSTTIDIPHPSLCSGKQTFGSSRAILSATFRPLDRTSFQSVRRSRSGMDEVGLYDPRQSPASPLSLTIYKTTMLR